jgi:hypothetical protein
VHSIFEFATPAFCELREQIWLDMLVRAAEEDVPGVIFTLVFEPTLLPGFYDRLEQRIEAADGTLHPFELRCSLDENQRRIVQPERRAFLKGDDPLFLRDSLLRGDYDPPRDLPGNVVIDTTKLTAAETARQIYEHLQTAA